MKSNSQSTAIRRIKMPVISPWTTTCLTFGLLLTITGISRPTTGQQMHPATTSATIISSTGFAPTAGPAGTTPSVNPQPNCSNVKSILELRGVSMTQTADDQANVNNGMLRFCEIPSKGACCQNSMELKLASLSRAQLEKNTKESISKLSSVLGTRANKFNDYFKQLLSESKREFHEMFMRTYGVIYEQNSYVFSDLFSELENYYTRGKVDLADAMDNFFNVLYQKMFTVLNAQYKFDDKYLVCVSEHMKELKPFGDVPDKLSVQIKRSFVATRTFEQALATAAEVAKNLISLRPSAECTAALTRMQQCGLCRGYTQKPCSNYCVNVMKGCMHYYDELDDEWDNFVASMEKVSERLLGPFNIVMVVEPINIKISEAIMNFQDTGEEITKQVFHGCGKPQLGRRRRSVNPKFQDANNDALNPFRFAEDDELEAHPTAGRVARAAGPGNREIQYEPLKFSRNDESSEKETPANNQNSRGTSGRRKTSSKQKNRQMNMKKDDERDENKEPMIDKLVKDIRQKVKDSKKFWTNLPFQICNQEDYSANFVGAEGNCWNGNSVDKYPHAIVQGIASNPEFPQKSTVARQSALVNTQLFMLKNAVGHLRNAYNGLDVEWNDVEDSYDGSGSGAGSGDDDEDDPNGGSGLGPYDYPERTSDNIDTTGGSDSTSSTTSHGSTSGLPNSTTSNTNNKDEYDERENEVNPDDHKKGTTSSGSRLKGAMSLRQAVLTYMFPIYVAWFGGILCDLF